MNKGVLLFAHNSKDVDYAMLAIISGGLAKKNLNVPVSLVTDSSTVEWMKASNNYETAQQIFDQIILTDRPITENRRKLHDGNASSDIPFINANRYSAWNLTPYDRTLLIDVDFLILSNRLSEYWDCEEDIMISKSINDISLQKRIGYHDRYISDTGVHLYWATTVMFTKNEKSRVLFNLVKSIKDDYQLYGDIYSFNTRQYRNDIAFSIAKHILGCFNTDFTNCLPPVMSAIDKDVLADVIDDRLLILINENANNFTALTVKGTDVHIMNKQSVIRNAEKLLRLI
jgi:hypothetical protein